MPVTWVKVGLNEYAPGIAAGCFPLPADGPVEGPRAAGRGAIATRMESENEEPENSSSDLNRSGEPGG